MYVATDGEYVFDSLIRALYDAENNTAAISGLTVTQTAAGANQAVDVAAGVYLVGGTRVTYAGGNIAAPAADATNPRKDILVADNAGALTFTQGTAAAALPAGETGVRTYQPVPPNIPASRIILAEIWRAANDNTIANADITEKFILVPSRMIGRELLTAQGQIIYASAAQTPAALAPGTNGYFLKTQGAGANPIWTLVTSIAIVDGTYAGDDAANRAIPHGLGVAPKAVFITPRTNGYNMLIGLRAQAQLNSATGLWAVTAADATNFYVGNATSYPHSGNGSGITYDWVAFT